MLVIYFTCMSHHVDFNAASFFAENFQPMNTALIFQIGLNDCARGIRGNFREFLQVPGKVSSKSGPTLTYVCRDHISQNVHKIQKYVLRVIAIGYL